MTRYYVDQNGRFWRQLPGLPGTAVELKPGLGRQQPRVHTLDYAVKAFGLKELV